MQSTQTSNLSRRAEMLVIGGGIVGRTAALALARDGRSVTLVDPGATDPNTVPFGDSFTGPASLGNAGHIATEQLRPLADPSFLLSAPRRLFRFGGALDLGWRRPASWLPWSLRLLRACAHVEDGTRALTFLLSDALPAWQRLAETLGTPDLVQDHGHLMLWRDPVAFHKAVASWQRAATGTATFHEMAPSALSPVADRMHGRFAGGLRFEHTGQVSDPVLAMRLLDAAFATAGGQTVRKRAARLLDDDRGVLLDDGTLLPAHRVLLTAGVGTARLLRHAGITLPLVAERGYHLEWRHGTDWPLPPLVFEELSVIVSRFGDRLRASSFVEFDREEAPPDPRKWQRLEQHVRAIGLPVATPFRRWMGARPTLPDYLPAIGAVPGRPDLFVASGHGHLGLTLAPRTAEIMLRLVRGEQVDGLTPFDPGRFGRQRTRTAGS